MAELDKPLQALGQVLVVRVGQVEEVLETLSSEFPITAIRSHEETGSGWTYGRDLRVKRWCRDKRIPWHEYEQTGVIRRLEDRNGWAAKWYRQMQQAPLPAPERLQTMDILSEPLPEPEALGLKPDGIEKLQLAGREAGLSMLQSFLQERGEGYSKEMSSPVTAYESCSRLSTHLAFGTVSTREVFHATQSRSAELALLPRGQKGKWPSAMRSFSGRLRWHCHFMQKLEDEPRIEFENMHSAYDGLRENEFNEAYFTAWCEGRTGYPMVDACMRALTATGWLNFRMRAMLMSFASYHLWLHWRRPALHLANLFTDYEPGIHYSQCQMQSGTTGINTIRIYNPIKQGQDHDPDGDFIRHWIPELREMPVDAIHTPWKMPNQMNGYPMPIVDEKIARKAASERLWALRRNNRHREEAQGIVRKHGSRKAGLPKMARRKKKPTDTRQGELPV